MTREPFVPPLRGISDGFPIRRSPLRLATAVALVGAGACASGGPGGTAADAPDAAWQALATPRPAPVSGAVRLSFSGVELPRQPPWAFPGTVGAELGLSELIVAGLLRRSDVDFVERRRFSAAAQAERAGSPRPPGAPRAGLSAGPELVASGVWLSLPGGQVSLEVRLRDSETGALVGSERRAIPATAGPVGAARSVVAATLAALDELGRLPVWDDPLDTAAAPATYRPTGVTDARLRAFLMGLAAEERWNWEAARRFYQVAAEEPAFFEAGVALARTARLRLGGTLGES